MRQDENKSDFKTETVNMSVYDEAVREDTLTTLPHTPIAQPVILRKKRNKRFERSKRCVSVIIEPTLLGGSMNNNSRRSMYELGADGWVFDKLNDIRSINKALNLDEEINTILNINSSVDVTLGS